ncbi:MAG TPA: hypothetical protein VNL17_05135 [Verrucomicrobiae bacterium]|nr:hypothetical protein [Verrucomicrobiae bacterium]
MRTCYCLILAVWLLAGLYARADTVKLKDGTALEGEIVSEDASSLSILLEFAGGTITQTRRVDRADIAAVIRWTPEQRAEHQIARDYENLQKYQLSPSDSYRVEYYDQVISDVFGAFLKEHPNSPYASNVTERIVGWKAERDLVAAGNVKFRGRWSPAAEVAPQMERAWGQQLLQESRELMAQRRFETAVQRLQFVVRMERQPELASAARPLLVSAYQSATNSLDRQQRQLVGEVSSARDRVDRARQALRSAEATLAQATDRNSLSTTQAHIAVDQARSELNAAQNQFDFAVSQRDAVKQRLTTLKAHPPELTTPTNTVEASRAPPAPSPAPPPAAESPEVLGGLVAWAKNNWVAMAIIVVAILFFISRFLIKD